MLSGLFRPIASHETCVGAERRFYFGRHREPPPKSVISVLVGEPQVVSVSEGDLKTTSFITKNTLSIAPALLPRSEHGRN